METVAQAIPVGGPQKAAEAQPGTTAMESRLQELATLLQQGAISEEEYILARSRILNEV